MHVTLLTPAFAHPEESDFPGIRRYSSELVAALRRKGLEVRVITPETPGSKGEDEEPGGVEVIRLGTPMHRLGPAVNIAQARILNFGRSFVRSHRFLEGTDIVHADVPLLGIDAVLPHCPVVAAGYHIERIRSLGDLASVPFGNSYGSYTFRLATAVVVPSEASAERFRHKFNIGRGRLHSIHPGIDQSKFHPDGPMQVEATNSHPKRILFVGPMSRRKNVPLLIQAFERLIRSHPEARLILVGTGSLDSRINGMIRDRSLASRVARFAHISDSRLHQLYNMADVYASASVDEGFGLSVVEAMASRLPVVVSDTPVSREVVGSAGIRVGGTSPEDWTAALKLVLDNPEIAETLADQGYSRATRLYTWEESARKHFELYRNILDARAS